MKGINMRLWNNLKQHIFGCCGSSKWVLDTGEQPLITTGDQSPPGTVTLATALATDRRQLNVGPTDETMMVKPFKTILRLFEIDDRAAEHGGGVVGELCCVCSDRSKGAALIPCGHTYCRVCCRAMWLKKEACPICSRLITEVLEIF
ncbi:putative transcription factor C2H2 family [Helianthus annuus]|nr:putative transcription factor C2H2 family [Helianthus annuus]